VKQLLLAALVWVAGSRVASADWIFRSPDAVGIIEQQGDCLGQGILIYQGVRFRLLGPGHFFQGWFIPDGYFAALVFDPVKPWVVGVLFWRQAAAVCDFLSADQQKGELRLKVERRLWK